MEGNNVDLTFLNPYLDKMCGKFYNPKKLFSYHKPISVVQSSRSTGKTTSFAMCCALSYILKGYTFFFLRRRAEETIIAARDLFEDAVPIIQEHYPELGLLNIVYEGGKFVMTRSIDDEVKTDIIGRCLGLNEVYKRKSINLLNCRIIWMDEFVANDTTEYLGKAGDVTQEGQRLTNFYTTVDRCKGHSFMNATSIWLTGNSTTLYNPIFLYFDITRFLFEDSQWVSPKRKNWVVQRLDSVEATKDIESSFGYQMSNEKQQAYHNNTDEWTSRYVSDKPQQSRCRCNIIFNKMKLGIWYSEYKGLWYIGQPDNSREWYSLDIEGHENTDKELFYGLNSFYLADSIRNAYMRGRLFFANYAVQRSILAYLKLI